MSEDNELAKILAIVTASSQTMAGFRQELGDAVGQLQADVKELKGDVVQIKTDVLHLQADGEQLMADVAKAQRMVESEIRQLRRESQRRESREVAQAVVGIAGSLKAMGPALVQRESGFLDGELGHASRYR